MWKKCERFTTGRRQIRAQNGLQKVSWKGGRQPRRKENEKYYSVTIPQMCHEFLRCYISFFRSNVETIQRPSKSVNRNSLLYHTSIYRHPRYIATNCGERTVALYRGFTLCVFLQVCSEFHFVNRSYSLRLIQTSLLCI